MEVITYITSAVAALVATASFALALNVHKMQRNLMMPKLVVFTDLIEGDDREAAYGLFVKNVGQHPAISVNVKINIEEWRDGHSLTSKWDEWDSFGESIVVLQPQEHRVYELPSSLESYIVTASATSSNCSPNHIKISVGSDLGAFREVMGKGQDKNGKFIIAPEIRMDPIVMKDLGKVDEG